MQFDIRHGQQKDLPQIQAIYADAVVNGTASYELVAPDLREISSRFEMITADEYPWIVAAGPDEKLAGYAYAGPFRTRPAYRYLVEDSIYIAPDAKRQGVGSALLGALIDTCRARGYRQILAVIGDGERNLASVALHASHGFTSCGTIRGSGYKQGRWLDTELMQLSINGGNETHPS